MHKGMSRLARVLLFGFVAVTAAGAVFPAYAEDHGRGREGDRGHWRGDRGWERRPDVYYSAPPVVYPPYGYYAQPGISLNFGFPFR
jgi:hypothetical protein